MVVLAVQEICVADLIVRESDLAKKSHKAILSTFHEILVTELMSCLVSVISSALSSYYKMCYFSQRASPPQMEESPDLYWLTDSNEGRSNVFTSSCRGLARLQRMSRSRGGKHQQSCF